MEQVKHCSCYYGVDQMINEGLGGGFIIYEYDRKKLEPKINSGRKQPINIRKERNEPK